MPFDVKKSLIEILFHPELKLNGRDILKVGKLADKIEECKEENVLLSFDEYEKLSKAMDVVRGLGKESREFVKRILEAEDTELEEKK